MTLDESTDEKDIVVTSGPFKVAYEKDLDEYLSDVIIDYENTWFNKGFSMRGGWVSSC